MSRTIWIGDVHGCLQELKLLIEKFAAQPGDEVVLLGDLVDKGPDSEGVVRYCRENRFLTIRGNHDDKHIRYAKAIEQKRPTTPKVSRVLDLSPEDLAYLECCPLAYRKDGFVGVHAGIAPAYKGTIDRYVAASERKWSADLMYTRYVHAGHGGMIQMGKERPEDPYHATVYDGRYGTMLYGHQVWLQDQPKRDTHAIGVDLGCVYGGYLCGVVTAEGQVQETLLVKALQEYCSVREPW